MRVIGKTDDGKLIKQTEIQLPETDQTTLLPIIIYPSPYYSDRTLILQGTEDQFKTLISTIIRDVESDREDVFTKHYLEKQKNPAVL